MDGSASGYSSSALARYSFASASGGARSATGLGCGREMNHVELWDLTAAEDTVEILHESLIQVARSIRSR